FPSTPAERASLQQLQGAGHVMLAELSKSQRNLAVVELLVELLIGPGLLRAALTLALQRTGRLVLCLSQFLASRFRLPPLPRESEHPKAQGGGEQEQDGGYGGCGPPSCPQQQPLPLADRAGLDRLATQEMAQILSQRLGAGVALSRLLVQALQANRLQ